MDFVTLNSSKKISIIRTFGRGPSENKDGNPITTADDQAEKELDHFAQPEHSRIRDPNDICQDYNKHAYEAILMRAVLPTPIDNVIAKSECRNLFAKAKPNRAARPHRPARPGRAHRVREGG